MAEEAENHALLALNRMTRAHPRYARSLVAFFGSARAAVDSVDRLSALEAGLPESVANNLAKGITYDIAQQLDRDLEWLDLDDHFIVSQADEDYPDLLAETHDPPLILYCDGDRRVLDSPGLAMVGSRSPSRAGAAIAKQFAGELAAAGLTITSGMAIGIDGFSHEGALAAGGRTIAVLGTGCDRVYPGRHARLAQAIRASGLLMSEFPLGTVALPRNFPQRNRIVTGLCYGTLVVEATLKSGSLISARLAMEQGREVFAVPGPIRDRRSRGCHHLIKQGAKLTESVNDIAEELADRVRFAGLAEAGETMPTVTASQARILALMDQDPQSADTLTEQTGLAVQEITAVLIELEVEGLIERRPGGFVRSG